MIADNARDEVPLCSRNFRLLLSTIVFLSNLPTVLSRFPDPVFPRHVSPEIIIFSEWNPTL